MTASSAWVRIPEALPQARIRLFCFPYAGAGVSAFREWSALLRPEIEVCLVQFPGREDRHRERCFTRLTDLLSPLLTALRPYLDRPFAFFGHSLGGAVAFEVARSLQEAGGPAPLRLCVAARRSPQLPDARPPFHVLPAARFLEELQRRNERIPNVILETPELLRLFLTVLRADLEMSETYAYQRGPALALPISAFGGLGDQLVRPGDLEGWRDETSAGFALTVLAGDHFFLKSARAELLHGLRSVLLADAELAIGPSAPA